MMKHISCNVLIVFACLFFAEWVNGQMATSVVPMGFVAAPSDLLQAVAMPAINTDSLLAEDAENLRLKEHPFRFGYNHLVYYKPENSGTWTQLDNGDRIWQLDVKTPGAFSVNLGFSGFHLPEGAALFVYSKDHKQVLGPYTSANNAPDRFFGSELIKGDEAVLEYYEPAAVRGQSSFILFRITQGYKSLHGYLKSATGFGASGPCIRNINCPEFYDFDTQKRAVVCVVIGGNAFCSGTLVNNTLNDGTPYILSANHCLADGGGTVDGTWLFRFNWEAPGCNDPASNPSFDLITGATLVANNGVSDFLLVRMNSTPSASYHAFYAGWNYARTPATSVTIIHHPEADIKKCTKADNAVTDTFYDSGNGPAQVWQIGQYTNGATEPGSSGSPLFDQNKRIIGQLYGGPSDCDVEASNLRDYYGRFDVSWDSGSTPQTRLKDWLDPDNSASLTNDGYDPNAPVDNTDIQLTNVLAPVNSLCNHTITPSILVTNIGTSSVSSITVNYYADNGSASTYVWSGTLAPQVNVTINLPAIEVTTGLHSFNANINLPAGAVDQNLYNDSITTLFTVFDSTASVAPLFEGFEESNFPPGNWILTTPLSGTTWQKTGPGAFGQSGFSAVVNEFTPPQPGTAGETPAMITPPVNMANIANSSFLKFDVAYGLYSLLQTDTLVVLVSTNCGSSWTRIYTKGGADLATVHDSLNAFVPTNSQWRKDSVNISNLSGQTEVIFDFEVISGWGNALYIDNIDIADTAGSVGIAALADNMDVRVFPNPFSENFNLQLNLDVAENIDAAVYGMDGKKLITALDNAVTDAGAHQLEINTQLLSNGVYILKINERFFKLEKLK